MSIVRSAAANVFERRTTPPGTPWGDSTPISNGQIPTSIAGTRVTEQSAMRVGAVWACVSVLADGVATLPLRQYRGDLLDVKTATPMDPSPLIQNPWSESSLLDFLTGGQVSLALRGNFYGEVVERDKRLMAVQIMPLDPDVVSVDRDKDGYIEYKVRSSAGGSRTIQRDDVVHIRNVMRSGALVGLNPIEYLRTTLGLATAATEYGAAFFSNSAVPLGTLETEEDLTEDETLKLARAWIQAHQGINKAMLPAVLTGGVTFKETAFSLEDFQFIESRQLSNQDIAMAFRIPPHMISQVDKTTSWGAGIEQQMQGFVRFTLGGYLRRWERAFSALLPPGQFCRFDVKALIRPDTVQASAVSVNLKNAGVANSDELRDWFFDMGPIADGSGQTYLVPLNMGDAGGIAGVPLPGGST